MERSEISTGNWPRGNVSFTFSKVNPIIGVTFEFPRAEVDINAVLKWSTNQEYPTASESKVY